MTTRQQGKLTTRKERPVASFNTLKAVKLMLDGKKQIEIAREYGVSRQWINEVAKKARRAGFDV